MAVYAEVRSFSCSQKLIRVSVDYLHLDRFHDLFTVPSVVSIPKIREILKRVEVLRQDTF